MVGNTYRHALCIGINYNDLKGCVNDVLKHKDSLILQYGYLEKDIIVMRDDINKDLGNPFYPTRQNIINQLNALINNAKRCDPADICHLALVYSGHGNWIKDQSGDEEDCMDEMIISLNGVILDDELKTILINPIAELTNVKFTILMDCCSSGTNLDLRTCFNLNKNPNVTINQKHTEIPLNITMISGCLDHQESDEYNDKSKFYGAMTYCLHETLSNAHYDITYRDLIVNLNKDLESKGFVQRPQLTYGSEKFDLSKKFSF